MTTLADANRTRMRNTYCVYTVLRYSWWGTVDLSEICRVLYQINLRNSASRWFGPRRDEVTGEWRRLHNKELNGLYSLPNIVRVIKSRRMRCFMYVYMYVCVCTYVPLGRPRRRWECNIKMYLREVGCECMNWIELAQDRDRWRALVDTGSIKCGEFLH